MCERDGLTSFFPRNATARHLTTAPFLSNKRYCEHVRILYIKGI